MWIHTTFDEHSAEILRPDMLVRCQYKFPEIFVVTFQESIKDYFLENVFHEYIGGVRCGITTPLFSFRHNGIRLGFICSAIGGPAAVLTMEKLTAMGAKGFVYFGSCGSLGELTPDTYFIPTTAYRDEGTSFHYAAPSDYIAVQTAEATMKSFKRLKLQYTSGMVWTTDAIFRETEYAANQRRRDGCIAVDMECASLVAACTYRKVPYRYFMFSADTLNNSDWDRNHLGNTPENLKQCSLRTAFALAQDLYFSSRNTKEEKI